MRSLSAVFILGQRALLAATLVLAGGGGCTTSDESTPDAAPADSVQWNHLQWGLWLSDHLHSRNVYGGDPDFVHINGHDSTEQNEARVQCSSFFKHLLRISYGYTKADFRGWFGTDGPSARIISRTVADGIGFTVLHNVNDVAAGDVLAIEYPEDPRSTGHVMVASRAIEAVELLDDPMRSDSIGSARLEVVDAARTPHGVLDSRAQPLATGEGIGIGWILLYYDLAHENRVIGYRWHPSLKSTYYPLGHVLDGQRALAIGRVNRSIAATGKPYLVAKSQP